MRVFRVSGCVLAVGMLAQEGVAGRVASTVGDLTLTAFDVAKTVAVSSGAPSKVVGAVSDELLEVVEMTSFAVNKVRLCSHLTSVD